VIGTIGRAIGLGAGAGATHLPPVGKTPHGREAVDTDPVIATVRRSTVLRWLLHDSPYIAMLILPLLGVVFRLPVTYWVILMPVFGVITVVAGWSRFPTRNARLEFSAGVALIWCALLVAIYLLYSRGVDGVLNANANALAMMILLALGTFVAGVQARAWRICGVGCALFLAVPGLGWLDQSPLLMTAATAFVIALGGITWWASQHWVRATA
jgi:hypothetical protein